MSLVAEIRKSVTDSTPVFAAVGVTDLAVEKVREASARATAARAELAADRLQARAAAGASKAAEQAQHVPALALNRGLELAGKAQESYEELVTRGESLVKRVRTQKATRDLVAQAETTVALGKGAVTTVRKNANELQRSAKATLTTGRHEATVAAEAIADSVAAETQESAATVRKSAARTRTAAKRTTTTAKKTTKAATRTSKGTATGARKTAKRATKASSAASKKVGD